MVEIDQMLSTAYKVLEGRRSITKQRLMDIKQSCFEAGFSDVADRLQIMINREKETGMIMSEKAIMRSERIERIKEAGSLGMYKGEKATVLFYNKRTGRATIQVESDNKPKSVDLLAIEPIEV